MAVWRIDETDEGTFDVTRDARAFRYDLDDLDEALEAIQRSRDYTDGDEVLYTDAEGFTERLGLR